MLCSRGLATPRWGVQGVRQIAEARVETDKEEVKHLIRLLIADILPEVWVRPQPVRELCGLVSSFHGLRPSCVENSDVKGNGPIRLAYHLFTRT